MAAEEPKDKGFKIEDKRRFTSEGEVKEEGSQATPKEAAPETPKSRPLPPIDFVSFILSLASSVQVHLGLIPDPTDGKTAKNLEMSKQTIDVLAMLAEKTKGNLTDQEDGLLQEILHTLRMQFVEASK